MLLSAKNNLKKMAFFGLTEEQEISQYLFEVTFNLRYVQMNFCVYIKRMLHTPDDLILFRIQWCTKFHALKRPSQSVQNSSP